MELMENSININMKFLDIYSISFNLFSEISIIPSKTLTRHQRDQRIERGFW